MVFPAVMYGCEIWTTEKAEHQEIDASNCVLDPLDCKEVQPVHPEGNQSWIFIGRTDTEAGALIPWPSDAKSWLIRKDSDAGKDGRREGRGIRWLDRLTDSMDLSLSKLREMAMGREACRAAGHWVAKSRTWLSDKNDDATYWVRTYCDGHCVHLHDSDP